MKLETREMKSWKFQKKNKKLKHLFYFHHAKVVKFLNIYLKQKQELQK